MVLVVDNFVYNNWSSQGLTAHFVKGSSRIKIILGAKVLDENHTGLYIAEKLTETIENFNLSEKVHALSVEDIVESLLKKCRKLVGHFKRSEQASRILKEYQELCKIKNHVLVQDITTRWNSAFLMLERLVEQQTAVSLYATQENSVELQTSSEWKIIEKLVILLQPFYEATLELSFDSSCISMIIPLVSMIKKIIAKECDKKDELYLVKSSLRFSFNNRFKNIMKEEIMVATFLDPHFETKYFEATEIKKIKKFIEKYEKNEKSEPPREKPEKKI